ncbi:Uncharacterised protein [Mycobacteroides abscessus subsp. abscessus]|nr:Uncharacterised protein [Mycobacteroides abscessus subsp. abscessus]SKV92502.1 Uncharacterised protein [Mycobacteroides abscessus subsp. abscessus]
MGEECTSSFTTDPSDRLPTRPPPEPPTTMAAAPSASDCAMSPSAIDSWKLICVVTDRSSGTVASA